MADRLTQRIESLKNQINALKNAGKGVSESVAKPLQESVTILQKLRETARGEDIPFINSLIRSLQRSIPITVQTEGNIARLRDEMGALGFGSNAAAAGVDALTASLTALSQQSAAASDALLKLQNEGASPRAQISNLQNQKDIQEGIIANLKANGIQAGDTTRIRAARNEINRINSQIESLQNQIASDAREAAGKAKTAAEKAQKARDEQFAAIAETFGGRQENIENQIERAGIADNIAKQIRLSKALLASLLKERKVLLDRLKTLQVSNAVRKQILQAITRAIEDAQQDILRLNKEQAESSQHEPLSPPVPTALLKLGRLAEPVLVRIRELARDEQTSQEAVILLREVSDALDKIAQAAR